MRRPAEPSPLARQFEAFAEVCGPRYASICRAVAHDPALVALAERSPPEQRRPNLLLATVHDLLLAGADDPLADHYPTVLEWRRAGRPVDRGDPGPAVDDDRELVGRFRDFCQRHRAELEVRLTTRATQTNEVGRSTAILPALATVADRVPGRLAVVDLGAAAGLNLLFDRYGYDYGPAGRAGPTTATVHLDCRLRIGHLPWLGPVSGLPAEAVGRPATRHRPVPAGPVQDPVTRLAGRLGRRLGIDQRPLDPADPDDARWLLACQWPDDLVRFRRLRTALGLAASAVDEQGQRLAPVVGGDIVDDLHRLATPLDPDASLCLLTSWVAAYLEPAGQQALVEAVHELGRSRPLHWILAEQPAEVPGVALGTAPAEHADPRATAVALVTENRGACRVERLADMHPHGAWLRWYGG